MALKTLLPENGNNGRHFASVTPCVLAGGSCSPHLTGVAAGGGRDARGHRAGEERGPGSPRADRRHVHALCPRGLQPALTRPPRLRSLEPALSSRRPGRQACPGDWTVVSHLSVARRNERVWKAPARAPPCPPGRTVPSEGLGPSRTLSTVGCSSPHVGQTESSLSKLPGWPTQAIVTNATDALVPRPRRSHATPCYCWKWKSHKAELSVLSEQQWHRAQ